MIYKRKLKGKTNYKKRLLYLLSRMPRLVIRKSNSMIYVQLIDYYPDGDKTLVAANSKELIKVGYKGNINNTPSAYLIGLLIAKKAKKIKIKRATPDIGFYSPNKGSLVFALIKGAIDGGLDLKIHETVLPEEYRIRGEHISKFSKKKFDIIKNFEEVKNKLIEK